MSNAVIKIEDVSKQYRLGMIGTGTLSHDLNRWWHTMRGKEDPYLKIGEENTSEKKDKSEYVWALRDINFEINRGESLGIIGRNGAGKSTILKILSRVTGPTTGSFKVKGRIASLLEVGTGFHPELTGKENIFMNGAILGMTKNEIKRKFDEIVAFSGIERYIDTPAKRYSSGMYVRLAFAVAAHLDSEILIADEVLAVGDAEFQKKCLGKMKDVTTQGRTVLFVSHSMAAVRSFCNKSILLQNGKLAMIGSTDDVITKYMHHQSSNNDSHKVYSPEINVNTDLKLCSFSITKSGKKAEGGISIDSPFEIATEIDVAQLKANTRYDITIQIKDDEGKILFVSSSGGYDDEIIKAGKQYVICHFPGNFFNTGTFYINLLLVENRRTVLYNEQDIVKLLFIDSPLSLGKWMLKTAGPLKPLFEWTTYQE